MRALRWSDTLWWASTIRTVHIGRHQDVKYLWVDTVVEILSLLTQPLEWLVPVCVLLSHFDAQSVHKPECSPPFLYYVSKCRKFTYSNNTGTCVIWIWMSTALSVTNRYHATQSVSSNTAEGSYRQSLALIVSTAKSHYLASAPFASTGPRVARTKSPGP